MDRKRNGSSPGSMALILGTGVLMTLISVELLAQAASQKPLTWPQSLTLQGPLMGTFGIPVTQPGPVEVDLKVAGAPIIATLRGPSGELARQQGNGALHLSYSTSARDIQSGPILILTATLAQPQQSPLTGATVTVDVRHPPVDQARIDAVAAAGAANSANSRRDAQQPAMQQRAASARAQVEAAFERERSAMLARSGQERVALMARVQPDIDRLRSGGKFSSRAIGIGTFSGIQGVQKFAPNPSISGLTQSNAAVTQLHTGDPVFINGSGFGTSPGKLHFVLGAGRDLIAEANWVIWNDSQIYAVVPAPPPINGNPVYLPAFNGTVYLQRADGVQSNLQPMSFVPQMDYRTIWVHVPMADGIFPRYEGDSLAGNNNEGITRFSGDCFSGHNGKDQLFVNTQLKNGWVVRGAPTLLMGFTWHGGGGSVVAAHHPMSPSLAVDVLWWVNVGAFCGSAYGYHVAIPIQGPAGLPDGVAVQ